MKHAGQLGIHQSSIRSDEMDEHESRPLPMGIWSPFPRFETKRPHCPKKSSRHPSVMVMPGLCRIIQSRWILAEKGHSLFPLVRSFLKALFINIFLKLYFRTNKYD
jgi:hypothetical protein